MSNDDSATSAEGKEPHIMLSYQWDVKPEVLVFREKLREAGYRVWIDVEQMHKNRSTFDSMANAVENAVIVIPVLTEKYQQSVNCRKEIEYADKHKKRLVPVRMQKKFVPDGWLGFILGNTLFFDLSNPDKYNAQIELFLDAIKDDAKSAVIKKEKDVVSGDVSGMRKLVI